MNHTQRLQYLQQSYRFYISVVEIDNASVGREIHLSKMDVSVGETSFLEEPEIHDLLEINRFSINQNATEEKLKRREIKTIEDMNEILLLITNKKKNTQSFGLHTALSMIITL